LPLHQPAQRLHSQERYIGVGDQYQVALALEYISRLKHGVACAQLFGLLDKDGAVADCFSHRIGSAPHHQHWPDVCQRLRRLHRINDQRSPGQRVQYFGQVGFYPGSLAGCQNHDC
jgi:hypothetical protein